MVKLSRTSSERREISPCRPRRRFRPVVLSAVAANLLVSLVAGTASASPALSDSLAPGPAGLPLPAGSFGAPTSKDVTITAQGGGSGQNLEATNFVISAFEKQYPNIKVKLLQEPANFSSAQEQIIASSNPPDIVSPSPTAVWMSTVYSHHLLVPLTKLWQATDLSERAGKDINTTFLGPDGVHYLIENQKVFWGTVWYNKAMFAKAGITVPANHRIASLQDLYNDVAALKKIGKQGLSIGGKSGYEEVWPLDDVLPTGATAAQFQNYLTSYQASVPMSVNYTAPSPFATALTTLEAYATHGVFINGFLGLDEAGSQVPFVAGDAGMLLDGSWTAGVFKTDHVTFPYGWLMLPSLGVTEARLTPSLDSDWAISSKSKNIGAAELFLSFFLTNAMQAKAIVAIESNLSVVNLPTADLNSLDPNVREMIADATTNGTATPWTDAVPNVEAVTDPDMQAMWAGSMTPTAVAAQVQSTVEQLRK
jgi:raffinose/stachyose/melibiose transport system substrate-binding protein